MTLEALAFWIPAILLVASALAVVLSKNLFHSVLWLALALTCTAGIFLGLQAEFLAAVQLLLYAGGIVTIVPLLLFATAVRRVPLSVIGILQYIAPTIQFLLGVYAFHEPFTRTQLTGFGLVWLGLVVFTLDSVRPRSSAQLAVVDEGVR